MRERIKLSIATIVGLAAGSTMTAMVGGVTVDLVPPVQIPADMVRLTGPLARELQTKIEQSEAPDGEVTCRKGIISNHLDRVYCFNGDAGFLLSVEASGSDDTLPAVVRLVDGRIYVDELLE